MSGRRRGKIHHQEGCGTVPPPLLAPNQPDSPPPPPVKEEGGEAAKTDEVVLLSFQILRGPVGHALYAINLVPPKEEEEEEKKEEDVPRPPHNLRLPSGSVEEEDETIIYPILEIPSDQCPPTMCCVKLRSRLYYLGAATSEYDGFTTVSPEVYFVDIHEVLSLSALAAAGGDAPPQQEQPNKNNLLKKGVPMKNGKFNCYAFVAEDKIYALGPANFPFAEDIFEVFDPDSGQWSTLRPPRFGSPILGHAVVGDKVVFTTMSFEKDDYNLHYFDLRKLRWGKFRPPTEFVPTGSALYVGDCLYFDFEETIASLGPSRGGGGGLSQLYANATFASREVSQVMDMKKYMEYISHLVHLGNNKLCCVMKIMIPHPEHPYSCHPEKGALRVVVFEVTGERFREEPPFYTPPGCRGGLHFGTKLLHASQYIHTTTKSSGAPASYRHLSACFSASSTDY